VQSMGGSISVESEVGSGATFYVSIPFRRCEGLPCAPEPAREHRANNYAGMRVLLAEDDTISAIAAKRLLEMLGFSVAVAHDGRQVVDRLRKESFDMVLMDVQMPVMGGIEATAAIRRGEAGERNRGIPIIALTAHAMVGDREKFLESGMDAYMAKPLDTEILEETLDTFMQRA